MRDARIDRFLAAAGWAGATRTELAGDASARHYLRLRHPVRGGAILMDAGGDREGVERFALIARQLGEFGFSAPRILVTAPGEGLLLLEDLGDALIARVLEAEPEQAETLYAAAVDLLADLHRHPAPAGLTLQTPAFLAEQIAPVCEWYRKGRPGMDDAAADRAAHDQLTDTLADLLRAHARPNRPVLVHRDFHAENLIWLPDRTGPARLGLLDFQDALAGHPAYDLVSLLQDARRDLTPGLAERMQARYAAVTGADPVALSAACAVLGAQRNLRILGIFARLALRDGKTRYLAMMPRVWTHLQADLKHEAMAPLRAVVAAWLPAPEPALLDAFRA